MTEPQTATCSNCEDIDPATCFVCRGTQPAQPLDLAPIQARHQAATGGTWRYESYAGLGPNGVLGAANLPIGRLDFGAGDQADADRRFVLNAHTDTGKLIAEVLRLRELLDERTADIAERALENAQLRNDLVIANQENRRLFTENVGLRRSFP